MNRISIHVDIGLRQPSGSVVFLAAATRARVDERPLEVSGGWAGVLACSLLRLAVKRIGRPDAKRREHRTARAMMSLSAHRRPFDTGATTLLELFEQLGWAHSVNYRLSSYGLIFSGRRQPSRLLELFLLY